MALSCLLHLALIWSLNPLASQREPQIITVDFIPSIPEQALSESEAKRQIVSPSDQQASTSPQRDTALLSDRDSSTEHEQIRRGVAPEAGPELGKQSQPAPPSTAQKQVQSRSAKRPEEKTPPKLSQLRLDAETVQNKFSLRAKSSAQDVEQEVQRAVSGSASAGYNTFSRPMGAGAAVLGLSGSPDYLPNLPDGDITMLNAKASQFAVFVRRVATQVFAQLRSQGWDALRAEDIVNISQPAIMRATLSPHGDLIKVEQLRPSGSTNFDDVLRAAIKAGARDPNPPKEAVDINGNYSFIFQSQSWARMAISRNGAPTQRRWLLLATGLE